MWNEYEQKYGAALQQANQVPGAIMPRTRREQLEWRKKELTDILRKVDAALDILNSNPELEKFIDVLQEAGL